MPELPEVEVVRRGLAAHVVGRTIAGVEVFHPRSIRRHVAGRGDFVRSLVGARVHAVRRRGKYLWLALADDPADLAGDPLGAVGDPTIDGLAGPVGHPADLAGDPLGAVGDPTADSLAGAAGHPAGAAGHPDGPVDDLAGPVGRPSDLAGRRAVLGHLGMSGQLLLRPADAPDEPHLRIRFRFADGDPELRFVDQRTFGGMAVVDVDADGLPVPLAHIARDPLDPGFDDDAFSRAVRRRHTGLKRALLDQSLVSGIGNIYADEALWRARLHYARPTETLTRPQVAAVLDAARAVMTAALGEGGTSFDRLYVDVNGRSGYFDRSLSVYGRGDRPCQRCGTPIRRDPFMNRSSYTCPRCQPKPRRPRW